MALAEAPAGTADSALPFPSVRFVDERDWTSGQHLCCDGNLVVDDVWGAAADESLSSALALLAKLGSLPRGDAADNASWAAADVALAGVQEALGKAGLADGLRAPANHSCAPGAGTACCRQVRAAYGFFI